MAKEFKKLEQDYIDFFEKRMMNQSFAFGFKIEYQCDNTQKQLIKLTKIPANYAFALDKELLVTINTVYFDDFEEKNDENENEINKILFDSAISTIEPNNEKGTFRIARPSFVTNDGILTKYSYDKVKRALEVERLYEVKSSEDED